MYSLTFRKKKKCCLCMIWNKCPKVRITRSTQIKRWSWIKMVFKFLEMVVMKGSGWYYQGKEGREKKGSHPRLKSEEEEPAQEEGQKCSDREKPGEQASRKLAAGHVPRGWEWLPCCLEWGREVLSRKEMEWRLPGWQWSEQSLTVRATLVGRTQEAVQQCFQNQARGGSPLLGNF